MAWILQNYAILFTLMWVCLSAAAPQAWWPSPWQALPDVTPTPSVLILRRSPPPSALPEALFGHLGGGDLDGGVDWGV